MPYRPEPSTVVQNETHLFDFENEKYVLTGFYETRSGFSEDHWSVMRVVRRDKQWVTDGDVADFDGALVAKIVGGRLEALKAQLSQKPAPPPSTDCGCS